MTKTNGAPLSWDAYEYQPLGLQNPPADIRACACGGEIVVVRTRYEDDVVAAVLTHAASPEHEAWRRRREADDA